MRVKKIPTDTLRRQLSELEKQLDKYDQCGDMRAYDRINAQYIRIEAELIKRHIEKRKAL